MAKEEVPEGSIIYIDDDLEPSPLSKMEVQIDRLKMPPPVDNTLIAAGTLLALSQGSLEYTEADPQRCHSPERRRNGVVGKKLQDRRKARKPPPQIKSAGCSQNAHRIKRCMSLPGVGQTGQHCGSLTMTRNSS